MKIDDVAKIQKAIKERYGDIAIANYKSFWDEELEKKYLEEIKEEYDQEERDSYIEDGDVIINSKLFNRRSINECEICSKYCSSFLDSFSYYKFNVCNKCYIINLEGRINGK